LEAVLAALNAAEIPVIVLKGAALAHTVYRNPAVRPMCDVDLLVQEQDVPTALDCCKALKYETCDREAHAGDTLTYENEIMLRKPETVNAVLELHWSLFDSPYYQAQLPMEWFWETAQSVTIEGITTRILGTEAQILHLCGHLALHHGHGTQLSWHWLYDIAALVMHPGTQLDWTILLQKAQAFDLVLSLRRVLKEVDTVWSPPILSAHLTELNSVEPSAQEARIFSWLTAEQRPVLQRFIADLASTPGWRARLAYAWHNVFPMPHYMQQRYHIPHIFLLPLYYPYRWWLGIWSLLRKRQR